MTLDIYSIYISHAVEYLEPSSKAKVQALIIIECINVKKEEEGPKDSDEVECSIRE